MSSVKVVDLNEEEKELPPNEEATEEQQQSEIANEVVEEEEAHEEPKPKQEQAEEPPKPKPKAKPKASDIVKCDKCDKSMSYKNLRYSHNCDPKPVKKQANPKPKTKPKTIPKPPPEVYYSDSEEEEPVKSFIPKKQPKQPSNPLLDASPEAHVLRDITNQYALLQQHFRQQKQEKYSNLCSNMFSTKSKKR
jgi:hypothetical protein